MQVSGGEEALAAEKVTSSASVPLPAPAPLRAAGGTLFGAHPTACLCFCLATGTWDLD